MATSCANIRSIVWCRISRVKISNVFRQQDGIDDWELSTVPSSSRGIFHER